MDFGKLARVTSSKWYWPAVAAVSAFAGIGVGILVDRLTAGEEGEDPVDVEEPGKPVVVSERSSIEEAEVSSAFRKPDISTICRPNSQLVDYTKFYPEKGTDTDGDAEAEQHQPKPQGASAVEIISEEEFVAATGNDDGYVTATGTFFPDDRILAGWNDKSEPKDVNETIGEEAAALFEDESVDAVYVRNTVLKVLYEVVRGNGLYEDEG